MLEWVNLELAVVPQALVTAIVSMVGLGDPDIPVLSGALRNDDLVLVEPLGVRPVKVDLYLHRKGVAVLVIEVALDLDLVLHIMPV